MPTFYSPKTTTGQPSVAAAVVDRPDSNPLNIQTQADADVLTVCDIVSVSNH